MAPTSGPQLTPPGDRITVIGDSVMLGSLPALEQRFPGIYVDAQEFGLRHIAPAQLAGLMPDFAPHLGACRFYNCTHLHEPGCGVRTAVHDEGADDGSASQAISPNRYRIYADLSAELDQQAWQARGKA